MRINFTNRFSIQYSTNFEHFSREKERKVGNKRNIKVAKGIEFQFDFEVYMRRTCFYLRKKQWD
jgi:hypothetical protein